MLNRVPAVLRRWALRTGVITASIALLLPVAQSGVRGPATADAAARKDVMSRFRDDFLTAQRTTRGKGVTLAVLSTGVDKRDPTLRGVVVREHDLVKIRQRERFTGTALTGSLAGKGPSRGYEGLMKGYPGLVPAVEILSVRVRPEYTPATKKFYERNDLREFVAKGIRYAVDHGAQVILVDQGIGSWDDRAFDVSGAIGYATSKNVVVVAPNWAGEQPLYPAAVAGAISVVDMNEQGRPSGKWSARGSSVLVAAPGMNVDLPGLTDEFRVYWGPRLAAVFLTAAAVMIRAEYPDLPTVRVTEALAKSAHHPEGGYDTKVGFGILNPAGALREAQKLVDVPMAPVKAASGTFSPSDHFGGDVPRKVRAVPLDKPRIAGFGGLAAGGLLAILAALIILVWGRRRSARIAEPVAEPAEPAVADPAAVAAPAGVSTHQAESDSGKLPLISGQTERNDL